MKETLIYLGILVGILLGIASIIFGSYMPYAKSDLYISGLKSTGNVKSTTDFENLFRPALDYPSPVGQEEVVKYLGSDILGILNQNSSEAVDRELVNFMEPYMFKDNVRHLLTLAQDYSILWNKFHKADDYKKAVDYYLQAYAIGPKLPPVLYNLLQIYNAGGDKEGVLKIGNEILSYWDDQSVSNFLSKYK